MARRVIELPSTFKFSTEYKVLYSDINAANHLGADRVLPIAMEAQMRFIKSLGYDNALVFEDAGLIMAHSEVQYISEMSYGEELKIDVAAANFSNKSVDLVYRFTNKTKGIEAARVRASMLFFDYDDKKVIAVPEGFKSKFS